jgi:two-component system LytT family sensor kinase
MKQTRSLSSAVAGAPQRPKGIAVNNPDWNPDKGNKTQTGWERLNALPERLLSRKGIFVILLFLPIPVAMAMAEQDCRYVILIAHETPLFSAFFQKWSVDFYLWQAVAAATWYGLHALHLHKASFISLTLIHIPLGFAVVYLRMLFSFSLFNTVFPTGPYALRHPLQYYIDTRYYTQVLIYYALMGTIHTSYFYIRNRDAQLLTAELKTQLAQAQLRLLNTQLQPHFLFNAMNSISSFMRKDIERADEMLVGLSQLLRQTLAIGYRQEISLREELDLVKTYFMVQSSRFPNQSRLVFNIEEGLLDTKVPPMILQPLVENAFLHGRLEDERVLLISVSACRTGDMVMLNVANDGSPLPQASDGQIKFGVGLANVMERLECLYQNSQSFSIQNERNGGVSVNLHLPYSAPMETLSYA